MTAPQEKFLDDQQSTTTRDDTSTTAAQSTMSNLRDKLARALSPPRRTSTGSSPPPAINRSQSRGREPLTSTGRGGAGNMKRSESVSREGVVRAVDGDERGRELSPAHPDRITHSGRGGAGNVRSPSRDPAVTKKELEAERELIHKYDAENPTVSTGRGGLGNIKLSPSPARDRPRSQSRDAAPGRRYQSSGRGGAGNIHHENLHSAHELEKLEEDERKAVSTDAAVHSTGRGGLGGVTSLAEPYNSHSTAEAPDAHPDGVKHTGKGGFGNILHGKGHEEDRGRSEHKHVVGDFISRLTSGSRGPAK